MGIRRAEVIEVYSDLSLLTDDKIDQLAGRSSEPAHLPPLKAAESIIRVMPRDSIRARLVEESDSIICFPFFPSHLRLPVKVGEEVWVFFEELDSYSPTNFDPEKASSRGSAADVVMQVRNPTTTPKSNVSLGFWMCRPTSYRNIEDLNYAPFGRTLVKSSFEMLSADDIQKNISRSSFTPSFPAFSLTARTTEKQESEDEKLKQRVQGFSNFSHEPVARFTRRPSDTVIAGSHDSRIVLGQNRDGRPGSTSPGTGTIDLVAGTGVGTGAPVIATNAYGKQEVDKDPALSGKSEPVSEGDPDYASDASRILISENSNVDQMFTSAVKSDKFVDDADKSGPSIAARSQHIRVIATNEGSIRITVEGPAASSIIIDSEGNLQISSDATVSIQSPKIFLGTTVESATSGVLVGSKIQSVLTALRNDILGAPTERSPTAAAIAFPLTAGALLRLGLQYESDPLLSALFSKTVFASS